MIIYRLNELPLFETARNLLHLVVAVAVSNPAQRCHASTKIYICSYKMSPAIISVGGVWFSVLITSTLLRHLVSATIRVLPPTWCEDSVTDHTIVVRTAHDKRGSAYEW